MGADLTQLLLRWSDISTKEKNDIVASLYDELKRAAAGVLAGEPATLALQPTVLVHEAYMRLVDLDRISWNGRRHFLRMAAKVMRRVIVDEARKMRAAKRGYGLRTQFTDRIVDRDQTPLVDALLLDEALNELGELDTSYTEIVEARVFGGLTIEETAKLLEISPATVKRKWNTSRAWLFNYLDEHEHSAGT